MQQSFNFTEKIIYKILQQMSCKSQNNHNSLRMFCSILFHLICHPQPQEEKQLKHLGVFFKVVWNKSEMIRHYQVQLCLNRIIFKLTALFLKDWQLSSEAFFLSFIKYLGYKSTTNKWLHLFHFVSEKEKISPYSRSTVYSKQI